VSQNHNEISVSATVLDSLRGEIIVLDVRKPAARSASGLAIPGALWRHPFDAANWVDEFKDMKVAVYCVHGHEVSQAVRGYLAEAGIDAVLLEGGFEAWSQAGLPVEPVADADA
jgi:thiosulfate sulfurtransferase